VLFAERILKNFFFLFVLEPVDFKSCKFGFSQCSWRCRFNLLSVVLAKFTSSLIDSNHSKNVEDARSPVTNAKAIKNKVELEGMRQCHLRDAAAVVRYFWIEQFGHVL